MLESLTEVQRESLMHRFWKNVDKSGGCWLWGGSKINSGYGVITAGMKFKITTHRLSYLIHKGAIPEGYEVCHTCDVKLCINPDHLFVGTHAENLNDMRKKGRYRFESHSGEENGNSKLTAEAVEQIRNEYATGNASHLSLARKHGVTKTLIRFILSGKAWKQVGGPLFPIDPSVKRGSQVKTSKLTEADVREIRRLHAEEGLSYGDLTGYAEIRVEIPTEHFY